MLGNMDDTLFLLGGIPLHPLVIHVVVVLTPLLALGLVLAVAVARVRTKFLGLLVVGLGVTTAFSFLARQTGEALEEVVGVSEQHQNLGGVLPVVTLALFAVSLGWFLAEKNRVAPILIGVAKTTVAILAVVVTVLTVLVGHSGAESVWSSRVTAPAESPEALRTPTTDAGVVTAADVSEHATADDCWTIVDGDVYDLTPFISAHPGGTGALTALCGRDGTEDFLNQHASNGSALSQLASLKIATLTE